MLNESTSIEASPCLNISVEVFVPKEEIALINDWVHGHGLDKLNGDNLPEVGFMLKEDGESVGCVFLFQDKDARTGWLEGCLSNPYLDAGKVADNFEFALEFIEIHAKNIGVQRLTIFTSLFTHARKFINTGYTMINRCVALEKELV
jgi:hypothetical protein